jgi:hypothetical protein
VPSHVSRAEFDCSSWPRRTFHKVHNPYKHCDTELGDETRRCPPWLERMQGGNMLATLGNACEYSSATLRSVTGCRAVLVFGSAVMLASTLLLPRICARALPPRISGGRQTETDLWV